MFDFGETLVYHKLMFTDLVPQLVERLCLGNQHMYNHTSFICLAKLPS